MSGPLSLSGVELDGDSLVRRIYCDESGTSKQKFLVVAGVIVHGETQWYPLEKHIDALIRKYIAKDDRLGFYFHATDLFSGREIFADRDKYPLSRRLEALKEILAIPSQFRLPVIFGFNRRHPIETGQGTPRIRELIAEDHALAFCHCAIAAEKFMRNFTPSNELAEMIVEENKDTKRSVGLMLNVLRSSHPAVRDYQESVEERHQLDVRFLPLTKISESISWKGKRGARLLQVADACAFLISQYLEDRPNIGELLHAFVPRGIDNTIVIEHARASYGGSCDIRCWDDALA